MANDSKVMPRPQAVASRGPRVALWGLGVALVVFVIDLATPGGFACVGYVFAVLLSLWSSRDRDVYLAAGGATLLTLAGLFLPGGSSEVLTDLMHRQVAVIVFWITATLGCCQKRRAAEIAHIVAEKQISEWENVVLAEARAHAEAASRAKTEFIANVSHEVRTPLNGILGMTELTLQSELTSDQRAALNTVRDCGESLLALMERILDFSTVEAGKLRLETVPLRIRDALDGALGAISREADEKRLVIRSHVASNVPHVLVGDPARLAQVLLAVLANAVKFTKEGRIDVYVEVAAETSDEVCLEASVADTGIGIPPEKQRNIFEPFTQADGSSTRIYGGSGLGLSLAARLVDLMGGRMWLESVPGMGSTFYFTVRLRRPERIETAAGTNASSPGREREAAFMGSEGRSG